MRENRYANTGNIVIGDDFIGRNKTLRLIEDKLLGKNFGNLAIIGVEQIGKTSLIHQALVSKAEELFCSESKVLPVYLDLSTINVSKPETFFLELIMEMRRSLIAVKENFNLYLEQAKREVFDIRDTNLFDDSREHFLESQYIFQELLTILAVQKIRPIIILDEFDFAVKLFKGDERIAIFQKIRELSSTKHKLAVVTISRKSLEEIEKRIVGISTLAGTFTSSYLTGFDSNDMNRFKETVMLSIPEVNFKEIVFFTGNHPFLLGQMCFELANCEGVFDFRKIRMCVKKASIIEKFNSLINTLRDLGLFESLLKIIVGPVYNLSFPAIMQLERYGIIIEKHKDEFNQKFQEGSDYSAFSPYFEQYLQLLAKEVSLWEEWNGLENRIRDIVKDYFSYELGGDIENLKSLLVESKNGNKLRMESRVNQWIKLREEELEKFPERASRNLLDQASTNDLKKIIISNWSYFSGIFLLEKSRFISSIEFLISVRNPLAHSREELISTKVANKANLICMELLENINSST